MKKIQSLMIVAFAIVQIPTAAFGYCNSSDRCFHWHSWPTGSTYCCSCSCLKKKNPRTSEEWDLENELRTLDSEEEHKDCQEQDHHQAH